RTQPVGRKPWRTVFVQFSVLMIVLMLGNIFQVAFWALLYRVLGAFEDFETAMYFSWVTFTSRQRWVGADAAARQAVFA
ncbi:hypothetical protein ACC713_37935, partial [Rhizobium johnstonii]